MCAGGPLVDTGGPWLICRRSPGYEGLLTDVGGPLADTGGALIDTEGPLYDTAGKEKPLPDMRSPPSDTVDPFSPHGRPSGRYKEVLAGI